MDNGTLLEVRNLKKYFPVRRGVFKKPALALKAVDGVDLVVNKGETVGLVGESGCGKTTLGRCILRLEEPTDGSVMFGGQDILSLSREALRSVRRDMQIVFQDPYSSLDPRKTVRQIIAEGFRTHRMFSPDERAERVVEIMRVVGLLPEQTERYPHEFSGGQRQRIGLARALVLRPKLIIADEPVSSLDVSIQAQILNLLIDLQRDFDLTYVFISHDLRVVRHISDRVAVMYLGRIVEMAPSERLFERALHPYTEALISAVPNPNPEVRRKRILLEGDIPSPIDPPANCAFHPRCPFRQDICTQKVPVLEEVEANHQVACFFPRF
jgi:oligopeptide/dipeptide ABC transporter ATP-binding protein